MWGGESSDTWETQWWSVGTSSLHHLWGNKPHLTFHRQVRRWWLNFHFVGWTVPLRVTPQKQPVVSLMVCLLHVKLILFHYQLKVSCRSFKWARGSLNATESRDSQHLYLTYLLAQPSGMNCSSFLQGRAQRAGERDGPSAGRGSPPQEDKPVCVWRAWTFQLYRPDRLVPASTHSRATRSITQHLTAPSPTELTEGLPRGRRGGRRRGRRCLSSPRCRAEAPRGPRTLSRTGSRSSSWGVNVCRAASCLRIQTSPPPTPRSSSARVFLWTLNGRGQRCVGTLHHQVISVRMLWSNQQQVNWAGCDRKVFSLSAEWVKCCGLVWCVVVSLMQVHVWQVNTCCNTAGELNSGSTWMNGAQWRSGTLSFSSNHWYYGWIGSFFSLFEGFLCLS